MFTNFKRKDNRIESILLTLERAVDDGILDLFNQFSPEGLYADTDEAYNDLENLEAAFAEIMNRIATYDYFSYDYLRDSLEAWLENTTEKLTGTLDADYLENWADVLLQELDALYE